MANVYVRGKTLWIFYSVDANQYQKTTKMKNTKENTKLALQKCIELEQLIESNAEIPEDFCTFKRVKPKDIKVKVSEDRTEWNFKQSKEYFYSRTDLKPKNKIMYELAFKTWERLQSHDMPINNHSLGAYNNFSKWLLNNRSYDTARTYINYMVIFLKFLQRAGILTQQTIPLKRLKKKGKQNFKIIPDEHFKLILSYLEKNNKPVYNFINLLRLTGFRKTELLELTWEQVRYKDDLIDVDTFKDDRRDIFPLNLNNGELKKFLKLIHVGESSGKLFNFNPYYPLKKLQQAILNINTEMKKEDKKWKDIPRYSLHDIRRTFGTYYADKLTPVALQTLMRHRNISTTLTYYVALDVLKIAEQLNQKM